SRQTNRLGSIARGRGGVAHRGDDDVPLVAELDSPCYAARGEKLRTSRRGHAPNPARGITVMRRHLASVTLTFALREIIEREFARRHAATEHERAVAIVRHDVIALDHGHAERRE